MNSNYYLMWLFSSIDLAVYCQLYFARMQLLCKCMYVCIYVCVHVCLCVHVCDREWPSPWPWIPALSAHTHTLTLTITLTLTVCFLFHRMKSPLSPQQPRRWQVRLGGVVCLGFADSEEHGSRTEQSGTEWVGRRRELILLLSSRDVYRQSLSRAIHLAHVERGYTLSTGASLLLHVITNLYRLLCIVHDDLSSLWPWELRAAKRTMKRIEKKSEKTSKWIKKKYNNKSVKRRKMISQHNT